MEIIFKKHLKWVQDKSTRKVDRKNRTRKKKILWKRDFIFCQMLEITLNLLKDLESNTEDELYYVLQDILMLHSDM